eukprot:scaffold683_cov124-Cylindrotheca_fusiformis.AAC.9
MAEHQAILELGTLRNGKDVLSCMKRFRESMLTCELNIKDPSEAFLAIKGAAQRFHPSHPEDTKQDDSRENDDSFSRLCWSITEEALWATAVLCCVCVGPAWRSQIHRRKRWGMNTSNADFSDSMSLPSIPESLPTAILGFASSINSCFPMSSDMQSFGHEEQQLWKKRKGDIAAGQRYVVLSLCCQSPDIRKDFGSVGPNQGSSSLSPSGPKADEWTIVGTTELVGKMVMFWLGLVVNESSQVFNDWTITLRFSKATADLIDAGWRFLPEQNMRHLLVEHLLNIAKRGISFLDTRSTLGNGRIQLERRPPETECQAALASARVAINALTSLWQLDLIPLDHYQVAREVFRLHVVSSLVKAHMIGIFPLKNCQAQLESAENDDSSTVNEFLLIKIEACIVGTADLLRAFLDPQSNRVNSIWFFIEIIDTANPKSSSYSLLPTDDWDSGENMACMEACTAIRMISDELWGRGPMVVPLFGAASSGTVLATIRTVAAGTHSIIHERMNERDFLTQATCDMLTLALDTLAAFDKFAGRQLGKGVGHASGMEWDTFLLAVEEAFIPWHRYSQYKTDAAVLASENEIADFVTNILDRAHLAFDSLLFGIGGCLDKFVATPDSPFHSVVSYESKRRLLLFLLQTAIVRMEPTDAELLGVSAFRAWVKFGQWSFELKESVSEILLEGFSKFENGIYVHSPQVRLAALQSLVCAPEQKRNNSFDSDNETNGGSISSDTGMPSFTTMVVNGESLGVITSIAIPILQSILLEDAPEPLGQRVVSLSTVEYGGRHRNNGSGVGSSSSSVENAYFPLGSFAVRLLGQLARDHATKQETKAVLIDMLLATALDSRRIKYRTLEEDECTAEDTLRSMVHLECSLRIGAVAELHSCLIAPFGDHPSLHGILPQVVRCLRRILVTCTDAASQFSNDEWQYEEASVAFASLLSLCRLKPSCEGKKVALVPMGRIRKLIPDYLFTIFQRHGFRVDRNVGAQVAYYVDIVEVDEGSSSSGRSIDDDRNVSAISFQPIVSSISTALRSSRSAREDAKTELCKLLQSFGSLCFYSLAESLLSGFSLPSPNLLDDRIVSLGVGVATESIEELLERSKMLAALTASAVGHYRSELMGTAGRGVLSDRRHINSLLSVVLCACDSSQRSESIAGCRAVLAILPSLSNLDRVEKNNNLKTIFSRAGNRLRREVMALDRIRIVEHEPLIIQEVIVLLSILHDTLNDATNEASDVLDCFDLCKEIIEIMLSKPSSFCLHLAVHCLVASIARLPYEAIKSLASDKERIKLSTKKQMSLNECPYEHADLSDEFIELLLSELSNDRLLALRDIRKGPPDPDHLELGTDLSYHEDIARELENMERFRVEQDEITGSKVKGAWLCGNSLLVTCSIGASNSRYRGWVEVVARSTTCRKREMVRLESQVSVKSPDIPSLLWCSDSKATDYEIEIPSRADTSMELVSRYNFLIRRFDDLMPPLQQGETVSLATSSTLSRNTSAESDATDTTSMDDGGGNSSIYGWLRKVLGSESNVHIVQAALQESLKLPQDLIERGTTYDEAAGGAAESRGRNISPVRKLKTGPQLDRAISVLDRTTPVSSTHKIGVLYACLADLEDEMDPERFLLSVEHCSPAFLLFTEGLGKMVMTKQLRYFSGGLDVSDFESDGRHTRVWIGNEGSSLPASKSVVVYHIVHLMPPGLNNRKRHIGNDNVLIMYVEKEPAIGVDIDMSEDELKDSVVSGHFGFATIYVSLVSARGNLTRVTVPMRDGLPEVLAKDLRVFSGTYIVATPDAPAYVRGLAIRLDLACRSVLDNLAPPSNCNERFRMLREMKRHCLDSNAR